MDSDKTRISAEARDWILRLDSGEIDAAGLADFRAWLAVDPEHQRMFDARRQIWQGLADAPELGGLLATAPAPRRRIRRWIARRPARIAVAAIAASLALVVAAPRLLLITRADHRTAAAVEHVGLPDGSLAVLDAGSAIAVDFDARERRVDLLAGNAFFRVRHGDARPFRVGLPGGVAEDVGTAFEVRHEGGVSVIEGQVRAIGDAGAARPPLLLGAGQSATLDPAGPVRRPTPAGGPAAWRDGIILIERAVPDTAIAAVARYRTGPTWVWADLGEAQPIDGAFHTDRADEALTALAMQSGLVVRFLPGGLAVVTRSGS